MIRCVIAVLTHLTLLLIKLAESTSRPRIINIDDLSLWLNNLFWFWLQFFLDGFVLILIIFVLDYSWHINGGISEVEIAKQRGDRDCNHTDYNDGGDQKHTTALVCIFLSFLWVFETRICG